MSNETETSKANEPLKCAPFYHSWWLKNRKKGEKQRLLFFDVFCKIAWEGYIPKEDNVPEWDCYCDIYPMLEKSMERSRNAKKAANAKAANAQKKGGEKSSNGDGK